MTPGPRVLPASLDRGDASPGERTALFEALCVVLVAMREAGMLGQAVRLTDAPPAEFGLGATGPLVRVWQGIIGAKPDGVFGAKETLPRTRAWAHEAGFGDRSTVTPAMWATGVGVSFRFEPGAVVLPDGSRVTLDELEAGAAATLAPPAAEIAPA